MTNEENDVMVTSQQHTSLVTSQIEDWTNGLSIDWLIIFSHLLKAQLTQKFKYVIIYANIWW